MIMPENNSDQNSDQVNTDPHYSKSQDLDISKGGFLQSKYGLVITSLIVLIVIVSAAFGFYIYRENRSRQSNPSQNTSSNTSNSQSTELTAETTQTVTNSPTSTPIATNSPTAITITPTASNVISKLTTEDKYIYKLNFLLNNSEKLAQPQSNTIKITGENNLNLEISEINEGMPVEFLQYHTLGKTNISDNLFRGQSKYNPDEWIYTNYLSTTATCGKKGYVGEDTVSPCGESVLAKKYFTNNLTGSSQYEYFWRVTLTKPNQESLKRADEIMKSLTILERTYYSSYYDFSVVLKDKMYIEDEQYENSKRVLPPIIVIHMDDSQPQFTSNSPNISIYPNNYAFTCGGQSTSKFNITLLAKQISLTKCGASPVEGQSEYLSNMTGPKASVKQIKILYKAKDESQFNYMKQVLENNIRFN